MAAQLHIKDNLKYWRVTELKELFFYTLYMFHAYWDMGTISHYAAKRIANTTRQNVAGYKIVLRSNDLKHFLYRHYAEKNSKQRDIKIQDIEQLPKVINNLSFVELQEDNTLYIETQFPNNELFVTAIKIDHDKKLLIGKSFRIKT